MLTVLSANAPFSCLLPVFACNFQQLSELLFLRSSVSSSQKKRVSVGKCRLVLTMIMRVYALCHCPRAARPIVVQIPAAVLVAQ